MTVTVIYEAPIQIYDESSRDRKVVTIQSFQRDEPVAARIYPFYEVSRVPVALSDRSARCNFPRCTTSKVSIP